MAEDKTPQKKEELGFLILSIVFSLLLILVAVFFILKPLFIKVSSLQVEMKNEQAKHQALLEKINTLQALKGEYEKLEKEAIMANAAIPSEEGVGELFVQLENLAKSTGLSLKSFKKEKPQTQSPSPGGQGSLSEDFSGLNSFDFTLTTAGTYISFKNFLEALEKNIRPLKINSINFNKPSFGRSIYLDVEIKGKGFYLKK